jgi:Tol biopolymer transport system component
MALYRILLNIFLLALTASFIKGVDASGVKFIETNADKIQHISNPIRALHNDTLLYFNQRPPKLIPEIFAPGQISLAERGEFASVFSSDGTEIIFGIGNSITTQILSARLVGETWSKPRTIVAHERYSYMDAFLSPDETQLYYISNQPLDGQGEPKDPDLWFSNRTENGWGPPQNAGPVINSDQGEYYVSFTTEGTLYFTSNRAAAKGQEINFDIHAAAKVDGEFQKPMRLGPSVNSTGYDGDVFVAPDESYLIFSSDRPDGLGNGDLYVSFRTANGGWTEAKNMGAKINTDSQDYCPFVTRDGRYLFYSTKRDIYWVDASIIDTLR